MKTRKGISATQFMATLSTAGREEPKPQPVQKPRTMSIDRWSAEEKRFVEVLVEWNGEMYAEVKRG